MASASSGWSPIMSAPRFMPAPRVSAELPETGERFEGLLPPVGAAPPLRSASPPSRCSRSTIMSAPGSCRRAIRPTYCARSRRHRANILVAGGTSTGKTTLTNALLAEVAKTSDRVVIIEDTRELQCAAPNLVAMRTKDGVATLSDLVRSSLRLRPDRIPIGEVRGAEALDLLKAWGTGHPGGDRHHPCRLRRSARCGAWSSSFRKRSSPSRAR
jgi:Flp pilus assembly CpaF family ATPase